MKKPLDNLEEFVVSNREKFDFLDPDPKLWRKVHKSKKVIRLRRMAWKVAAILVILLIYPFYTLIINNEFNLKSSSGTEHIIRKIPELHEADIYYTSQINDQLQLIKTALAKNPDLMTELKKDMDKLDDIHNELLVDLNDNIDNKDVVEALIQNYRMKVSILEGLLDYISNNDINEASQHEL